MSIDGWLDKTKKVSFFGMTAHFIEEHADRLVLNDRILCTREMDAEIKDGPDIKSQIEEHLKSFHLYEHREQLVFISDRGTNMVSALRNMESIHCYAHMLNNTVQHMLDLISKELDPVKALVKYFKVTGLNCKMTETLKSYVQTRWNSVFYMIQSVLQNWKQIQEILLSKKETKRLDKIDIECLKVYLMLISILCDFDLHSKIFSFLFGPID